MDVTTQGGFRVLLLLNINQKHRKRGASNSVLYIYSRKKKDIYIPPPQFNALADHATDFQVLSQSRWDPKQQQAPLRSGSLLFFFQIFEPSPTSLWGQLSLFECVHPAGWEKISYNDAYVLNWRICILPKIEKRKNRKKKRSIFPHILFLLLYVRHARTHTQRDI